MAYFLFCQAAILQQTGDYIYRLEHEKTTLLNQVVTLKKLLKKYEKMEDGDSPSPKRRKRADSMMDEGIGSPESLEDAVPTNRVGYIGFNICHKVMQYVAFSLK